MLIYLLLYSPATIQYYRNSIILLLIWISPQCYSSSLCVLMFVNRLHMYIYVFILSPKSLKNVAHRHRALFSTASCSDAETSYYNPYEKSRFKWPQLLNIRVNETFTDHYFEATVKAMQRKVSLPLWREFTLILKLQPLFLSVYYSVNC